MWLTQIEIHSNKNILDNQVVKIRKSRPICTNLIAAMEQMVNLATLIWIKYSRIR